MKFQFTKKHTIDFLFPLILFFLFSAFALTVILLASNTYSHVTQDAQERYETRTSLAYIKEKIRQNDTSAGVSVSAFENIPCLMLHQVYGDTKYTTYIYEKDGFLKELFLKDGISASPSDGKNIMSVTSFQIETVADQLFRFSSTDKSGNLSSLLISTTSAADAGKGAGHE